MDLGCHTKSIEMFHMADEIRTCNTRVQCPDACSTEKCKVLVVCGQPGRTIRLLVKIVLFHERRISMQENV